MVASVQESSNHGRLAADDVDRLQSEMGAGRKGCNLRNGCAVIMKCSAAR